MRTLETAEPKADADSVLAVLATAMEQRSFPAEERVCAAPSPQSPEEGLALLGAYVSIEKPAVRQAILDAVLMIAGRR